MPCDERLAKRIIACLDVDGGRVVKGVQFQQLRDAGDPAELALAHASAGADEIVLLDITATSGGPQDAGGNRAPRRRESFCAIHRWWRHSDIGRRSRGL